MALDLTTIPEDMNVRILYAAFAVSFLIGDGQITADAQAGDAADALAELGDSLSALVPLYEPAAPGAGSGPFQTYPVIRNGAVIEVHREEMTDVEIRATIQRLRNEGSALDQHADALAARKLEAST